MRRIKNIIIDKWSSLIAYLVKTELFREDYNQRDCADKYRLIRAIHLGVIKFIVLVIFVCSVTAWFLSWPPEKGDAAGHYKYINSSNTLTEAVKRIVVGEHNDETNCETCAPENPQESQEDLNKFNKEKRDVNAQEGMWRAANALVALTVLQVFIGALTAIFLIKTFRTQRSELIAAVESVEVAKQASIQELKPYVSANFVNAVPSQNWIGAIRQQELLISIRVRNAGRTPASKVFISLDHASSIGFIREGSINSADFQLVDNLEGKSTPYIVGDSEHIFPLFGKFKTNEKSDWIEDQANKGTGNLYKWKVASAVFSKVCIRYKDIECEDTNWHKVVSGLLNYNLLSHFANDGVFTVTEIAKCEDKDHHHYARGKT